MNIGFACCPFLFYDTLKWLLSRWVLMYYTLCPIKGSLKVRLSSTAYCILLPAHEYRVCLLSLGLYSWGAFLDKDSNPNRVGNKKSLGKCFKTFTIFTKGNWKCNKYSWCQKNKPKGFWQFKIWQRAKRSVIWYSTRLIATLKSVWFPWMKEKVPYRRDIYEPLIKTSSQIVRVAAATSGRLRNFG